MQNFKLFLSVSFFISSGFINTTLAISNCSKVQIGKAVERCDNWSPAGSRSYVKGSCKTSGNSTSYRCELKDGSMVVGSFDNDHHQKYSKSAFGKK